MKKIRLSKSVIGESEKKAVMEVLDREFLGMGAEVKEFEDKIEKFVGSPAVCVSTGTAALQLAIEALDIGVGDEVLVPTLTYVASFQAISATGATPVACDIEREYLSIDTDDASRRITKRTKAIMVVHYTGAVGEFDKVKKIAEKNGLRIIEDAAHAFGSTYKGQKVGSFGDISCFSFDGIKNITSGEGGCVVTKDINVLERIRDARLLGVVKDTDARYEGRRSWEFDVLKQGWRYHMSNIMAAIGCAQLDRFEELSSKRQQLGSHYLKRIEETGTDRVEAISKNYRDNVPHIFVVRIKNLKDRSKLMKQLLDLGIETGVHYQPNHTLTYFKRQEDAPFPVTEELFPCLLTLPMHPDLSIEDVDYVVDSLISIIERNM